ncbi:MAG: hypothetical protein ACKN81_01675 [Pirellulaceae bacterium]
MDLPVCESSEGTPSRGDGSPAAVCCPCRSWFWPSLLAAFCALVCLAYAAGRNGRSVREDLSQGSLPIPPEAFLHAAASHGTTTMAIATGSISEEAEGVFFLDYLSGDLQCWVYNPRTGGFGGKFATNVLAAMPSSKNPEYLMVTGMAVPRQITGNARPANCIVYVMNVQEGMFAAYGVPWNRTMENAGQPQAGALIPIAGGQIRAPLAPPVQAPPPAPNPPKK